MKLVKCNAYLVNTVGTDGMGFSTRVSVTTALNMHLCISMRLQVKFGLLLLAARYPGNLVQQMKAGTAPKQTRCTHLKQLMGVQYQSFIFPQAAISKVYPLYDSLSVVWKFKIIHRVWMTINTCMMMSWHALLVLCEGNPPVTGGFPSQRASNMKFWCFLWC